jgi:hypothetical protein
MTRRCKKQPSPPPVEIGPDGWPVDPQHPINTETEEQWLARRLTERHHNNWRRLQVAAEGDRIEAIAAAVRYACVRREPPPMWLVQSVERLAARAARAKPGRKGRLPNPALHFARWELVEHLRSQHGFTLKAACKEASELSTGTPERGAEDRFEESYKEVQRAIKAGEFGRYAPFLPPD